MVEHKCLMIENRNVLSRQEALTSADVSEVLCLRNACTFLYEPFAEYRQRTDDKEISKVSSSRK